MIQYIKHLFRKVKRTIEFLPIVWNGYDFDYRYALDLFSYQLSRTATLLESDRAYSTNAKSDARRIRTIVELMEKVYDADYSLEHHGQMEAIYGKSEMCWADSEDGFTSTYLGLKWEKAITPDEQVEAMDMYSDLSSKSAQKHERAKKLLWKLIEHNLEKFWD